MWGDPKIFQIKGGILLEFRINRDDFSMFAEKSNEFAVFLKTASKTLADDSKTSKNVELGKLINIFSVGFRSFWWLWGPRKTRRDLCGGGKAVYEVVEASP